MLNCLLIRFGAVLLHRLVVHHYVVQSHASCFLISHIQLVTKST